MEGLTGGPVAKTPHSQCRGPGFDLWSGNQSLHATTKRFHAATKTWHSQNTHTKKNFLREIGKGGDKNKRRVDQNISMYF